MSETLEDIIRDAKQAFEERYRDFRDEFDDPEDVIHEIADSAVPVYTGDLMELAAGNMHLAVDEPELGPAFDGTPTPVNIVAANVYEAVEAALWNRWQEVERDSV